MLIGAGGAGLFGGDGCRGQLRLGEPRVDDLPHQKGVRQAVREDGRGVGHARRLRRIAQHREGA